MAKEIISIKPYKIQFDTDLYDIKQENDNTVIVTAKGLPTHTATISIWKEDPIYPLSTDTRGVLRDTAIMARHEAPNLPYSSISAPASRVIIDGREGFYARI